MSGFLGSAVSTVSSALGLTTPSLDEVSIVTGGLAVLGWESVAIHAGIDVMPWTFQLETTEFFPGISNSITILEGAPCQIKIGNDVVLTGYVLTVDREVSPEGHTVRVTGASKSVDLLECSAEFSTFQMNSTMPLVLTNKICAPFGIQAIAQGYQDSVAIQQFSVILTEHPYEIIERICRFAAVLFYDRPDGNVAFAPVGTTQAASGFVEGVNAERFRFSRSMEGRFSSVQAVLMNTVPLFTAPNEADLQGQMESITKGQPATDAQVGRYRPLLIPAEMGDLNYQVTKQRAQWEVNRRYGRSQVVELTCDSWRDSAGKLWAPNTLAQVTLPSVKCTPAGPMLIGELTFRRDMDGTHTDVVLMPSQAFTPEPIVINPMANAVGQAVNSGDASSAPSQARPELPAPGATSS